MSIKKFINRLGATLTGLPLLAAVVTGAVPVHAAAAAPPANSPSLTTVTDEQLASGALKPPTLTKSNAGTPIAGQPKGQKGLGYKGMPSAPGAAAAKQSNIASLLSGPYYWYNVGSQGISSGTLPEGTYANFTIAKPTLTAGDYHTLAEIAVQKTIGGQRQIVEVGWNVDPVVNGDSNPHLFVYHWVNGAPTCYNGCGFVDWPSNPINAGTTLSLSSSKKFGIHHSGGAWWIAYDTDWVGYFPDTLWTSAGVSGFTNSDLVQLFGEVASSTGTSTCTDMGNALHGTDPAAALIASTTYINFPTTSINLNVHEATPVGAYAGYTENALSLRSFRYGGPGC